MRGIHRLAILGVVVAGGVTVLAVVSLIRPTVGRTEAPFESLREETESGDIADTHYESTVLIEVPANIRAVELSRRALRYADPRREKFGPTYDAILLGQEGNYRSRRAKPAEPRPPTSCHSVEPVPKHAEKFPGPHRLHYLAVTDFMSASGFGIRRMLIYESDPGIRVGSRTIDRVELVSLLTDDEPSAYVLDEMATPSLARQAKRRPLDEFERRGLDAVRRGEQLVWTREAPTRMFGAIRARADCLECHITAKDGDLLGAFTYWLDTPVDRLEARRKPD